MERMKKMRQKQDSKREKRLIIFHYWWRRHEYLDLGITINPGETKTSKAVWVKERYIVVKS